MNRSEPRFRTRARLVGVGVSRAADAGHAVTEAAAELMQDMALPGICFVLVFVPDGMDQDDVAQALDTAMPNVLAFGCTTAGQITPDGYDDDALLLMAFPRDHFRCSSTLLAPLRPVSIQETAHRAQTLASRFRRTAGWNRFAMVFADSLSKQEDILVAALGAGLGDLPVFGGSAGHGLAFDETFVLHGGRFHSDAALLVLIETDLDIAGLEFDHFMPTDVQLVVTQARTEDRIVAEINGAPAASEYARLVGQPVDALGPQVFAENPLLVRNHNTYHARGIQQVIDGEALAFLSAIENGLVLTLGRGKEILQTLDGELSVIGPQGRPPDFILGFDCVLRRLEIELKEIAGPASAILRRHNVLGFNTYGEQHGGIHMNQTFVGIAFFTSTSAHRP